ncbi:MAG: transporter substrate-binding domain-containing protein [Pseudomonadota bacterium]
MHKLFIGALWLVIASTAAMAQQRIRVGTLEGARAYEPAIAAIYTEIGMTAEFVLLPPERSLKSVDSGAIDADMARVVGGTAGYPNLLETQEPLLELQLLAVVRKDFEPTRLQTADLKNYKLGFHRGTKMAEGLVNRLDLDATAANSTRQMLQMLHAGRFDVALTSSVIPLSGFPEFAGSLRTLQPPLVQFKVVHIVNKKWAALVPKIDAAVKAMKADGRWARLTTGL